jgi:hypothetical protein
MRVAIGGGRTSNSYELLVHHVDPDKVRLFPVEDLNAEETTSVLSTPLRRSEYARIGFFNTGGGNEEAEPGNR